ncbi:hypothetical protein ACFCZY_38455 [Streptomyces sp. NPDC056237]|uniref:hypothetical protein n=1 Tax=unclassified Streptomyces TaxID=2593676 RepID=UPI0035DA306B
MLGERPADRLDAAEAALVLVDERYERVCGRPSSAAKKDAAETWSGVVYAAFVVDTFSRRIVGWSAATVKETSSGPPR